MRTLIKFRVNLDRRTPLSSIYMSVCLFVMYYSRCIRVFRVWTARAVRGGHSRNLTPAEAGKIRPSVGRVSLADVSSRPQVAAFGGFVVCLEYRVTLFVLLCCLVPFGGTAKPHLPSRVIPWFSSSNKACSLR